MFRRFICSAVTAGVLAAPAFAQSPPYGSEPPGQVRQALPAPPVDEGADAAAFLRAAQGALAAGRIGETQEAMERAQTRLLDRSVPLGQTGIPSDHPAVKLISQGLQALAAGDRMTCARMIQAALQATNQP